jgi:hypothetical protein
MFQARADKVYSFHGQQADKPLHGESLNAYRRLLLMPFLKFSQAYKHSDLRVLQHEPAAFKAAEEAIYADAEAEGRNPKNVALGHLRMREENARWTRLHNFSRSTNFVDGKLHAAGPSCCSGQP